MEKKFSEFQEAQIPQDIDYLVGYKGSNNVRTLPKTIMPVFKLADLVIGHADSGHTELNADVVCTGTNDANTILLAINALPSTANSIFFLSGSYNIEKQLSVVRDNMTISGTGFGTVFKRMYNETGGNGLIDISGNYGTVTQLAINGNRSAYTSTLNHGIRITGSYTRIVGVQIHDTQNCIWNSGEYVTILRCIFRGLQLRGVYSNGPKCNISHSAFVGGTTGIHLYGSTSNDSSISSNHITSTTTGIFLQSGASRNILSGNLVIRGTGLPGDYTTDQYTIRLTDAATTNNFITDNLILGKNIVDTSSASNTLVNNKFE